MQQFHYCPNCRSPVAFGVRFCGNCGTQLNWPTQQQPPPPPQYQQPQQPGQWGGYQQQSGGWGKKIGIAIGITIAVAALIVCVIPLKAVAYTVTVDYEDTETYYEDEPYEATETYTEAVPLDYEVVDSDAIEGTTPVVSVTVQNTDSVSGTFTIHFSIKFSGMTITRSSINMWSKEYSDEKELHLEPDETKTAKHYANDVNVEKNDWSWNYKITPDTKTVEKQRTVTKYNQIEKQRTVAKQRPETRYKKVTLLDYMLRYQ